MNNYITTEYGSIHGNYILYLLFTLDTGDVWYADDITAETRFRGTSFYAESHSKPTPSSSADLYLNVPFYPVTA